MLESCSGSSRAEGYASERGFAGIRGKTEVSSDTRPRRTGIHQRSMFQTNGPHLDGSDVAVLGQVHPVGFVKLWTNQVSKVTDLVVLPHKSR